MQPVLRACSGSLRELVLSTRRRHHDPLMAEDLFFPNLRRLSLCAVHKISTAQLRQVLKVCGPGLTHFHCVADELDVENGDNDSDQILISPDIVTKLASFSSLESLDVRLLDYETSTVQILQSVAGLKNLRHLGFSVAGDNAEQIVIPKQVDSLTLIVGDLEIAQFELLFSQVNVSQFQRRLWIFQEALGVLTSEMAENLGSHLRTVSNLGLFHGGDDSGGAEIILGLLLGNEPPALRELHFAALSEEANQMFPLLPWNCRVTSQTSVSSEHFGTEQTSWFSSSFFNSFLSNLGFATLLLKQADDTDSSSELDDGASVNMWLMVVSRFLMTREAGSESLRAWRDHAARRGMRLDENRQRLLELGRALYQSIPVRDVRKIVLQMAARALANE